MMVGMGRGILAFLLISFTGAAANPGIEEKVSAALAKSGAPSISIAVVQNGRIAFAKAFGKADIAKNRAADERTRYAVGSISKQFTAAALLLAEEQHKLSLDDKVAKYFPDLTRAREISIRQLLTHTSGYEDYAPQDYIIPEWEKPTTARQILDHWAKKPLNFDPGTKWQYSNTNYVLAAEIFEKAMKRPLVAFLREKIFNPLGMTSAGDCTALTPEDATAYTRYALGPPRPVAREAPGWYSGAGELCMTPSDLARWDIAFLQKKVLSPRSYEEFTHEAILTDGRRTHYGLGLSIGERNGYPVYSHGGEVSGFLATNSVYPAAGVAVAVLSNEDGISFAAPVAQQVASLVIDGPKGTATRAETEQVRSILERLQQGRIEPELFTANARSYFTPESLRDYQASLAPLGNLKSVERQSEQLRGGMIHRSYRAEFEKKTVGLNVYVMPDGKYEQFLVVEQVSGS